MRLTDNRYFLLASAQLFPIVGSTPLPLDIEDQALSAAKVAFVTFSEGKLEAALEQYTNAIESFPEQPFFYACRSILNSVLDDDEGAFYDYQIAKGIDFNYQAFLEWLENKPLEESGDVKHAPLKQLLSDALEAIQQFDYGRALRLYTYAKQNYPEDTEVSVFRGALQLRLLKYDKALSDFNEVIRRDNMHFQAHMLRAKLFKAVHEVQKARADFNRAAEIQPEAAIIYEERGDFLIRLEHYEEALLDFDKLIHLLPEDFYVYALRADLLEKMGNWGAALRDYSTAITLNPYYSDLYAYRAAMKEKLGDIAGAAVDRHMFEKLENEE